jgi:hypothetical protein
MEDPMKDKEPSLEYYPVLREFEYVFKELPTFPPKRDIYFYIDLMHGVSPVSKTPYKMIMPELKEFQMQL